jgi:hypothetical protein
MPRGQSAEVGTEKVSQNGYVYIKTEVGWRLKHHLVAEEKLGRPIASDERVYFRDKNRQNFNPSNIAIEVVQKNLPSLNSLNKIKKRLNKIEEQYTEELSQIRGAIEVLEQEISSEALE